MFFLEERLKSWLNSLRAPTAGRTRESGRRDTLVDRFEEKKGESEPKDPSKREKWLEEGEKKDKASSSGDVKLARDDDESRVEDVDLFDAVRLHRYRSKDEEKITHLFLHRLVAASEPTEISKLENR